MQEQRAKRAFFVFLKNLGKRGVYLKKTIKIAIIASVLFAVTLFLFMQGQAVTRQVVVAGQDIPVGTIISVEMLRTERIPAASFLVTGVATAPEEVVGKTVTVGRVTGDLVPLAAVGRERQRPQPGKGFITVTVPVQEAAGAVAGDAVYIAVFDHAGGSRLLEGFLVVGNATAGKDVHLMLEADINSLLDVVPALASRAFKIIRR